MMRFPVSSFFVLFVFESFSALYGERNLWQGDFLHNRFFYYDRLNILVLELYNSLVYGVSAIFIRTLAFRYVKHY